METIKSISAMRQWRSDKAVRNLTIAFVPTMGALHLGHHLLVQRAKKISDRVVLSIFVNPLQFNDQKDFNIYPRPIKEDLEIAKKWDVDAVFCPKKDEFYTKDFSTVVRESVLSAPMCGKSRPGHFDGVLTVLVKLFNIVKPNYAFFGQKDMQQFLVVQRMIKDLNMDLDLVLCSTVHDSDGLAISSRNKLLNRKEREEARVLNEALFYAKLAMKGGEKRSIVLKKKIRKMLLFRKGMKIEYIEIVNAKTLKPVNILKGEIMIALAVRFSKLRLIDNTIVKV